MIFMSLFKVVIAAFCIANCKCAPVMEKETHSEEVDINSSIGENATTVVNGPSATLNFLRKFGYLEQLVTNASETLYSEERISQAIRLMQHFGAIPETGQLNNQTLSLLTKPRCGVPDIHDDLSFNKRQKRFTLGSKGWNKRRLTYRLENWAPQLRPEVVHSDLRKAFNVWAGYAHLNFINKSRSYDKEVDIAISFGRGSHGDNYPFDGAGGTLAHAFFPQNTPGLSGDVHFDLDENWAAGDTERHENARTISFLDVAVHELGHSLGLSHSPDLTSVMFPYYQVPKGGDPQLGHDDIMALYHLYITRHIEDGKVEESDEDNEIPRSSTTTESIRISTLKFSTELTTRRTSTTTGTHSSSGSDEEDNDNDTPPELPDICMGQFDTISFLRNELFVFQDDNMWRFTDKGKLAKGSYPAKTWMLFPVLKKVKKIDAAFERENDNKLIFISGRNYWTFDGSPNDSGPHPLTDFGFPSHLDGVDAAFVWGKNEMTYFFKDNLYWKYNGRVRAMEDGYPKKIGDRWRGVPDHLTSIITYRDDKTYIFKEKEFWRFDDMAIHTEEGFPMNLLSFWFNCNK